MAEFRLAYTCAVAAGLLLVAGCGKPEDARGYTGSATSVSDAAEVKTPAPPVPTWAMPLMGHNFREASRGTAVCKGVLDTVTRRHTGARKGSEIEGWGWDEHAAKPLAKVLFTDAGGKVVGGATVGNPRPDVPKAIPEVKTPQVGWRGVADVVRDQVQAIGVTDAGGTCVLGETNLG